MNTNDFFLKFYILKKREKNNIFCKGNKMKGSNNDAVSQSKAYRQKLNNNLYFAFDPPFF